MTDFEVVWIVQLSKEMKEFFDTLAIKEGDSAYGNGSRKVKRVLYDYMRFNQVSKA